MSAGEPVEGTHDFGVTGQVDEPVGDSGETTGPGDGGGEMVPPSVANSAAGQRRIWPAVLLTGLLGGTVGAGGVLWLDRAGYLPEGAAAADPATPPASDEIASLRGEVEQLRQTQAEAATAGLEPDAVAPLREQVAALERTVAELSNRPPAPGGEALAPIEARLTELEARAGQAAPDFAAVEERLAALETRPAAAGADLGPLEARLAAVETRLDQAPAAGGDPALGGRLDELERRLNETVGLAEELRDRPPVDLSGLETQIAELRSRLDELGNGLTAAATRDQVGALEAAVQKAATAEQVSALEAQIAAAPKEERVATLESGLAETRAAAEKGAALGPAVAADALTAALQSGAPYKAELDALRALGLDPAVLDGLAGQADAGLPTLPELRGGFDRAIAGVDLSRPIPKSAGPVNRLLQSARGLVEVRAAGPATGSDPEAVAGRLRAALDGGDVRAALAEWQALPEQAKASTAEWARQAEARAAAADLAARLRTEALSRIAAAG